MKGQALPKIQERMGVCSWSLRPESPRDLALKVRACGVGRVQLALDPIRLGAWNVEETAAALEGEGIVIASGMMGMEGEDYSTLDSIARSGGVRRAETWAANRAAAAENADIASALGIGLVTFHAGFLPPSGREVGGAERGEMVDRLRHLAKTFAAQGVRVGLETGQESAERLGEVLNELDALLPERARVGVNFDPANMVLYGMGEPVAALEALMPRVVQVHIKDAVETVRPGEWGREVEVGTGSVHWPDFLRALVAAGWNVDEGIDLVIEREAGERRIEDVCAAARVLIGAWGQIHGVDP